MGGKVNVSSELGKGSVFTIQLTVISQVEDEILGSENSFLLNDQFFTDQSQKLSNFRKDSLKQLGFNKPKMLFANDSPCMIDMYRTQFEDFFDVEIAENGMQAVQIVASNPRNHFDVIILDINMPIMDGFQAIKRIQQLQEGKQEENKAELSKSFSSGILSHIISISQISHDSNVTLKELVAIDLKPAPLIFALTGELSNERVETILKSNFARVYDRIGIAESKKIV